MSGSIASIILLVFLVVGFVLLRLRRPGPGVLHELGSVSGQWLADFRRMK